MKSFRRYRFGTFYAIVNFVFGAYYAWMTVSTFHQGSIFLTYLVACLIATGTGVGLLRKRPYGLVLFYFSFLVAWIEEISRWFRNIGYPGLPSSLQPEPISPLGRAILDVLFLLMTVLTVGYFYKRHDEFVRRAKEDWNDH